jgi:hypothetical protein
MEKPVFRLHVQSRGARFAACVNGVRISTEMEGDLVDEVWPVNHFMRSGSNELSLWLLPRRGASVDDGPVALGARASVRAALEVTPASDSGTRPIEVAHLSFDAAAATAASRIDAAAQGSTRAGRRSSARAFEEASDGDVVIGETAVNRPEGLPVWVARLPVDMQVGLPRWAFFDAEPVEPVDAMSDATFARVTEELFRVVERVHGALARRDVDAAVPLFEERCRELDLARHRTPGALATRLREDFGKVLADPAMRLDPIALDEAQLEVEPNARLATLRLAGTSHPLLGFTDADEELRQSYPILFRRGRDGWVITR